MIIMHIRSIFEQVYQILNHHRSLPTTTSVEQSNIRLIMHVINSMLMTTKWLQTSPNHGSIRFVQIFGKEGKEICGVESLVVPVFPFF